MSTTDVSPASSVSLTPPALPWWRYPLVWLVISGPAVVVVAGIITAWIAVRSQDPVVDENYYQKGLNINKTLAEQGVCVHWHRPSRDATMQQHPPMRCQTPHADCNSRCTVGMEETKP